MKLRRTLLPLGFALLTVATALLLPAPPVRADVGPDTIEIEITSPANGDSFDGAPVTIDVALDVWDPGLPGIAEIYLVVDDQEIAGDSAAPWGFEGVSLQAGTHELTAVAVEAGSQSEYPSQTVSITVFAGTGDDSGGCGCHSADGSRLGGAGGLLILGLLSLGLAARGGTPRSASRRDFRRGVGAETPLWWAHCKFRRHRPRRKDQARRRVGFHHGLLARHRRPTVQG